MPPQSPNPSTPTPPPVMPPAPQPAVDPSIPEGNAEEIIIKRHPFGLVALYLQAGVGLGAALGLIFFLIPTLLDGDTKARALHYVALFAIAAIALSVIFLVIATAIYRANRWIITNDSVTQILQKGLFNRQTSQLSMANIEDVTAEQKGLLAMLFGFGTLRCETAGELPYFHFIYCPSPNKYAKIILDARERFIETDPTAAKRANELLNPPGMHR